MLHFLWFEDNEFKTDIIYYRFCHLPFSLRSSPAILNGVIQKHLSQYSGSNAHVAKLLAHSFYVDDFIGGAARVQEGEEIYEASRRMSEGGFNLRKWHKNVLNLQKTISPEINIKISSHVKLLGLGRDIDNDQLYFDLSEIIKYSRNLPPTKRSLLRLSKKIFAPIKDQSVPRLELLGAVILARLMHSVYEALQFHLKDLRLFNWTDSYTALCWIKNQKP